MAGLILTVQFGAPLAGWGMVRALAAIGPRCADSGDADADGEAAEDEAPTTEGDPLLVAPGQSLRVYSPRFPRLRGIAPAGDVGSAAVACRAWLARRDRSGAA